MGKAFYRKYRPKSLKSVVGQEHITDTLSNAIKKGDISHAYLFTGPRGVGKTSVARILAYEINNIPYTDENLQLDIIEIDAASNRKIDEIRDLRDKVNIMPTSSKYKVYIIDEVHMLTREAFNALLKTLEEPPEHVVFILATTESHKVPDTIISRTQRFSFKQISADTVVAHLRIISNKEKINITDEALELIAIHGNGSFRDSISMLDQMAGFSKNKISDNDVSELLGIPSNQVIESLINSVADNNVGVLFDSLQKLREIGTNPAKTSQLLIKALRVKVLDKKTTDINKSVKLMKALLPLTGAQSSYEALEITLLDSVNFQEDTLTINKKPALHTDKIEDEIYVEEATASNEPVIEDSPEISIKISEEQLEEIVEQSSDKTPSSWNEVLDTLKSKHNTLYGVLRMAETKVENDKITLIFQFEFHKKQLHQAKNIATLKTIVDEKLGSGYTIDSIVVKKQSNAESANIKKPDEGALSNVSNIFGGAELLES